MSEGGMKKILLTCVLLVCSAHAMAEQVVEQYKNAIGFGIGYGSVWYKRFVSDSVVLVVSAEMNHFDNRDDTRTQYRVAPDTIEQTTRTSIHSNTRGQLELGLRGYVHKNEFSFFVQPGLGMIADRYYFNSYRATDEDKTQNEANRITLGARGSFAFGVEYFVTHRLSLEGVYRGYVDYLDYDIYKESRSRRVTIGEYGLVILNFYW